MKLTVSARSSPLSQKQVEEIAALLPHIHFDVLPTLSRGDRDLVTSLRDMEKTDFFTREIDENVLSGKARIAIHSAKDLPEPLPEGLKIVAITEGVDPSDSLVLPSGETRLKQGATVATSSKRREEFMKKTRPDVICVDIRGTIEKRLEKLGKEVDAVIIASAALVRLGLTHLNRIELTLTPPPLQGKLAIVAREGDREMEETFEPLDTRKSVLYLGLDPQHFKTDKPVIHCPVIETKPRSLDLPDVAHKFSDIPDYTHFIFTSQVGVDLFAKGLKHHGFSPSDLAEKKMIAVGKWTAFKMKECGFSATDVPEDETQEGLVEMMALMDLNNAYLFLPRSSRSRPLIVESLMRRRIRHQVCDLYDTVVSLPKTAPDLTHVDEIIVTSPSCAEGLRQLFKTIPDGIEVRAIGPITEKVLQNF